MSLILVFIIYMIFYAITWCFIMFICPYVGPLIWTNKILSYLILSRQKNVNNTYLNGMQLVQYWNKQKENINKQQKHASNTSIKNLQPKICKSPVVTCSIATLSHTCIYGRNMPVTIILFSVWEGDLVNLRGDIFHTISSKTYQTRHNLTS
jgi:hypothetical protein